MTIVAVAIPEPDCDNPDELRAWNRISIAEQRHRDFSDPDTPDFYSVLAFAKHHARLSHKPFAWGRLAWDIRRRFDEDDARELIAAGISSDSYSRFNATDERDATGEQIIVELDDATARSHYLEQVWHAAGVEHHAEADPRPFFTDESLVARLRPWQRERDAQSIRRLTLAYTNPSPTGTQMPAPNLSIVPSAPMPDLIQSSGDFVQGFVPPDYLVDGILQRRYFYSLTAQTGVGKTAVAMRLVAHVATGRQIGPAAVEKGTVLYLAGENPTDVQTRWIGLTRHMGIRPEDTDVHFMPGALDLMNNAERITAEIVRKGIAPALVVVDTAAAYNSGDDENSNAQAATYARVLRSMTQLPGGPCVIVLCHPTKRAADDDLIPRGGGAFLAEVDGNITLRKKDSLLVAAPGKFRGSDTWVMRFELLTVRDHPTLKDTKHRQITTVVAQPVTNDTAKTMEKRTDQDTEAVLRAVCDNQGLNPTDLARKLGWTYGRSEAPDHVKVGRILRRLGKEKLVVERLGTWRTTQTGEKELNNLDLISRMK